MTNTDYQNLHVWEQSVNLVVLIYKLTQKTPLSNDRGLISQIQRAAVSIPSNIAEGYRRKSKTEFKRFLNIASGSAAELETQLIITTKVYNASVETEINELVIIQKMLSSLIRSLSINHSPLPINHSPLPINHSPLPINHSPLPINHEL